MKKLTSIGFLLILLFVILLSGCTSRSMLNASPDNSVPIPPSTTIVVDKVPPVTTPPPSPSLNIDIVGNNSFYLPGEKIKIKFIVTNITKEELTLNTFPPITEIYQHEKGIVKTFEQGSQIINLKPNGITTYEIEWDQRNNAGNLVSPTGYYISPRFPFATKSSSFQQSALTSVPIIIRFPQGDMQKTIEVNQSQTKNGVTITLERIEFSEFEMMLYTLKTPPIAAGRGQSYFIAGQTIFQGTYTIDDGTALDIGQPGYDAVETGVKYIWRFLPMPSDAKTLNFSISSMSIPTSVKGTPVPDSGDYGPFEFKINLQ